MHTRNIVSTGYAYRSAASIANRIVRDSNASREEIGRNHHGHRCTCTVVTSVFHHHGYRDLLFLARLVVRRVLRYTLAHKRNGIAFETTIAVSGNIQNC